MNLLEAYSKRLAISESVYGRQHNGEKMDNNRKLTVAKVLSNTNNFLNEAFEQSVGTQRADMGLFKKFCLNLTTVALPNLIANDLVIVHPMSSMSGFVTYINYTAGSKKGDINDDPYNKDTNPYVFNNPFMLGDVKSATYTADRVTEALAAGTGNVLAWTPVVAEAFEYNKVKYDVKIIAADGTVSYKYVNPDDNKIYSSLSEGTYSSEYSATAGDKVAYVYDNVVIPQRDLPILNAKMESIPLLAKARRIAVYYSQIAAFQAKTDYGFDLGDQLAEKAVGQLSYEIDTEVVQLLAETAGEVQSALTWSKTLPVGVSKTEHYAGFAEILEIGRQIIYDRTRRFAPNYMIIASDVLPVLTFIPGFTAAPAGQVNGPYFAGTLNAVRVYVSPAMDAGKFCIGCNGDDMMSSVAVYAPYMAIVPTQLLQYADGGTSQGWSTLYDLKVLNANLIVKGQITA